MTAAIAAGTRVVLPLAGTCCAPPLRQPLTASQAADLARLLKALADPTRPRLVSPVAAHDGGEACVCDLAGPLGLTQPTISHHLKILVEARIFSRDKRLLPALLREPCDVLRTVRHAVMLVMRARGRGRSTAGRARSRRKGDARPWPGASAQNVA